MIASIFDSAKALFSQIHITDLIDLLLVWFVIYRILLLTKRSGAVQVLSGMGILAMAFVASIHFDLVTFNYLLEKFFANLFLIVVILFQGEIRRALAQIGSNPFLSGASKVEETHIVEELAKGVVALSQKGLGALVVIEKEIALDYFIEEGTLLSAEVSSEILQSIFQATSPLHDGAVIIRNGRIHAAGCFLPLSKNPALDRNLGTRHRAAIGLTEETDALVLVVSEENKSLSIVQGGTLTADVDHAKIRMELYEAYGLKFHAVKAGAL